ncbi:MAG: hypothetical protein WBA74_26045 [Cyclobacteriaceae bacterium]
MKSAASGILTGASIVSVIFVFIVIFAFTFITLYSFEPAFILTVSDLTDGDDSNNTLSKSYLYLISMLITLGIVIFVVVITALAAGSSAAASGAVMMSEKSTRLGESTKMSPRN